MMISTHAQVCPCFNTGHYDFLRVFCKIKTFLKIEIQTLVHFLLLGMINFYFVNSFVSDSEMFYDGAKRFLNRDLN
jgi:hypothetical protein